MTHHQTDTDEIDVVGLLTPDEQTTAKRLRGKYQTLAENGVAVDCDACTAEPETPHTIVAAFPLPWDDADRLLCQECWATNAAQKTSLDEAEATLLALKSAGLSIPEMASATGRGDDELDAALQDLYARTSDLATKRAQLERTTDVLGAIDQR